MTLRYKASKGLLWLANRVHGDTNPNWPNYRNVDNTNNFSRDYLASYVKENKQYTIKDLLDEEGWVDVTEGNAQEVIDDLQAAVDLYQTQREQEELNK